MLIFSDLKVFRFIFVLIFFPFLVFLSGCFFDVRAETVEKFYSLNINSSIYRLSFSGQIKFTSKDGLVRLVLVDEEDYEYLVYESSSFLAGRDLVQIESACDETCLLDDVHPKHLRIERKDAQVDIEKIYFNEDTLSLGAGTWLRLRTYGIDAEKQRVGEKIELEKVEQVRKRIKDLGMDWKAERTPVSSLPYSEKKKLFGGYVPDLKGFDYYVSGVFEFYSEEDSSSPNTEQVSVGASDFPESWDWRDRHGENWVTPNNQYQDVCASCASFAVLSSVELYANLYYNKHLDWDLSEQEILSCSQCLNCSDGGSTPCVLDWISSNGVVDESCFPYQAADIPCSGRCGNPQVQISIGGSAHPNISENGLKNTIIKNGGAAMGIFAQPPYNGHAMHLIGYRKSEGKTVWIFKNSWRHAPLVEIIVDPNKFSKYLSVYSTGVVKNEQSSVSVSCTNKDGDDYCNWGLYPEKPESCPASCSSLERDCDDSDSTLGSFDANGNCTPSESPVPTNFPTPSPAPSTTIKEILETWGEVTSSEDLNDDGIVNGVDYGYFLLDFTDF